MITLHIKKCFDNDYLSFVLKHFEEIKQKENGDYDLSIELSDSFSIEKHTNNILVNLQSNSQLFFAFTIILSNIEKTDFSYIKKTPFESINFMYDCSRAAVLNIKTAKSLIIYLAKLGYNALQLYTEDTYEIEGEPYFGHLRGRLTKQEIKEIDSFAKEVGIELIPCIQTLAHLDNIFLWPRFENVFDNWDCLLIGKKETYELIDKMFKNISECFSSRTINIGYDECYHAGRGKYLDENGYKDRIELLYEHLKKVTSIASKYGFRCIVYSDMFFNNSTCLKRADFPSNLSFNYWNYYSTNKRVYDRAFDKHLEVLPSVNFTAGAWKWLGPAPLNKYGMLRLRPGVTSASNHNVKTITLAAWGDNGNECALFAAIPQIVYFSKLVYFDYLSQDDLNTMCKTVFGIPLNDFMKLDIANGNKNKYYNNMTNPAKYILYNDPLCGIMDYHIDSSYSDHFNRCLGILRMRAKRANEWAYLFNTQIALCDYLSIKANMGNDLYKLYNNNDKEGLRLYIQKNVPKAIKKLTILIDAFRTSWYKENKTFGFDVIENRLGGQMQRLNEIIFRVEKYLSGEFEHIEELEQPKLPCNYSWEKDLVYKHNYKDVISTYHTVS